MSKCLQNSPKVYLTRGSLSDEVSTLTVIIGYRLCQTVRIMAPKIVPKPIIPSPAMRRQPNPIPKASINPFILSDISILNTKVVKQILTLWNCTFLQENKEFESHQNL